MRKYTRSAIFQRASLIRDTILSANDGIITTFAVVAGAQGAHLSHNTVILLGLANLAADAISMASGNFLGVESENEILDAKIKNRTDLSPSKSSGITFLGFILAGSIPLIPYVFFENTSMTFETSIVMVVIALIGLGFLRGAVTAKHKVKTMIETVFVGGVAALAAYSVGYWGDKILSN